LQFDTQKAILLLRQKSAQFDVFLCHNEEEEDKDAVRNIGKQLKEQGISPWLDEWEVPPDNSYTKK